MDVPQAERRLHDLRVEEWSDLGLGALTISLSLVATHAAPALALPLFLGGVAVVILGGRAFFRRWDLCEHLLLDPAAYEIPEVSSLAECAASLRTRAFLAGSIRTLLAPPRRARVELVADELAALAGQLEDESLRFDPLSAVRCKRLLTDVVESPLLNSLVSPDGLPATIRSISHGFD
jgi:hypothetical protein